jgi:hypothetical protein
MYPGSSSFSILKELVHLYTEAEMSAGSAEPRRRPYEGRGQSAIVIGEIGKKLIAHMMEREDGAICRPGSSRMRAWEWKTPPPDGPDRAQRPCVPVTPTVSCSIPFRSTITRCSGATAYCALDQRSAVSTYYPDTFARFAHAGIDESPADMAVQCVCGGRMRSIRHLRLLPLFT